MPGLVVIVVAIVIAGIGLRAVAFVDAVRRPAAAWAGTDLNRRFWLIVIMAVPFAGAAVYFLRARPVLDTSD